MAKSVKIKRKELNQPDQFISTTDVVMAYCSKHKTGLISVVAVLILVVLSGFLVCSLDDLPDGVYLHCDYWGMGCGSTIWFLGLCRCS